MNFVKCPLIKVLSLEAASVVAEEFKFENEKSVGLELERIELTIDLYPAPHICLWIVVQDYLSC